MSDGLSKQKMQDAHAQLDQALRRMAHAPVPEGLADRVKARLAATPRHGRLLPWPALAMPARVHRDWLRTAAAAAIVAVVAGGGWSVYSRLVQPLAKADMAVSIRALWTGPDTFGGGFSSAGAMRVPLTVNGPTVNHAGKKRLTKMKSKTQPVAR